MERYLLILVLSLGFLSGASAQNVVSNGDFSLTSGLLPTGWEYSTPPLKDPDVGGFSSQILNDAGSYPGGGNFFYLNAPPGPTPTLAQTLTVIPNIPYDVTGVFAYRVFPGENAFMVRFRDAFTNAIISSTNFTASPTWASFSFQQTFSVSSVNLELISQANGVDGDITVDNIAVVSAPAPEPGTLALVGLGMAGLVLHRRQRK